MVDDSFRKKSSMAVAVLGIAAVSEKEAGIQYVRVLLV
jgi:hypothetical protein